MRKYFIVFLALAFLLCSCDKVELEDRGIVIMLGIEKLENKIKLYAAFPDSEDEQLVKYAEGDNLAEAIENINSQMRQSIYFGHTRVCIISQDILEDTAAMDDLINTFEENEELSGRVVMLGTNESIEEILNVDTKEMTGIYLSGFYDYSNDVPKKDFIDLAKEFYRESSKPISLPFVKIKNESLVIEQTV